MGLFVYQLILSKTLVSDSSGNVFFSQIFVFLTVS